MRTKTNGALALLKRVFWDCDNTGNEIDIVKSNDPNLKPLKESLEGNVRDIEAKFSVSNSNSSAKGGKGGLVEKAEVDTAKAMKEASQKVASERKNDELEIQ